MHLLWSTSILVLFILSGGIGQERAEEGDLTVIIHGFENNDGLAMIALNNSQENFEGHDQAYQGMELEIIEKKALWTFEKIPFGEYAVKVFHDEDNDDELDKNFLGIPSEDYGFSNDARGSFGPASWEDAKFLFNSVKDTIHINIE